MKARAPGRQVWPALAAGVVAGAAVGMALRRKRAPRPVPPLARLASLGVRVPPAVIVPGLCGSELWTPGGKQQWLGLGAALGDCDLTLPCALPFSESRDDLVPRGLVGTNARLPRMFGFTEYADLVTLLRCAGFVDYVTPRRPFYQVFAFDWRRDIPESARRLAAFLDDVAGRLDDDFDGRFNLIGHSMGGVVARYYLRFGGAEPDAPVTWAGAPRIARLIQVGTPNGGAITGLGTILAGERVGLSRVALSAQSVSRMPAAYQLLPPSSNPVLLDAGADPLGLDLYEVATWERLGWGAYAPGRAVSGGEPFPGEVDERVFLAAALARARAVQEALERDPPTPCPVPVLALCGDRLPTTARGIVPAERGSTPRFEPVDEREARLMREPGDGSVTRRSLLASHLPRAVASVIGSGIPELRNVRFGSAAHHALFRSPQFRSTLVEWLLPAESSEAAAGPSGHAGVPTSSPNVASKRAW